MSTLSQNKFSTPQRLHERGRADRQSVNAILDGALLCHLGYVIDHRPVVTPTTYWREGDYVYWHGSSASRMMRHLASEAPLCLTVSLLDALVLARSAFHHSVNYRSVMLFGHAEAIRDPAIKAEKFAHFIDHLYPDRNAQLRPINDQEIKATALLRLKIDEGSAKIREGGPVDDAEDMFVSAWAGIGVFHHRVQQWLPDEATASKNLPPPQVMRALHQD